MPEPGIDSIPDKHRVLGIRDIVGKPRSEACPSVRRSEACPSVRCKICFRRHGPWGRGARQVRAQDWRTPQPVTIHGSKSPVRNRLEETPPRILQMS